jgi:hypothetical protein
MLVKRYGGGVSTYFACSSKPIVCLASHVQGYGVPAYVTTFFDVSGPDFFDWISSPVIGGILAASAAALVNWVFFQARVLFGANRNHG